MIEKADAVRASWKDSERIAARSRAIWSFYAKQSTTENEFSVECIRLRNVFERVSTYLANHFANSTSLKIEQKNVKNNKTELFISGTSTWRTSSKKCDIKIKSLHHYFLLETQNLITCEFAKDSRFINWPLNSERREECWRRQLLGSFDIHLNIYSVNSMNWNATGQWFKTFVSWWWSHTLFTDSDSVVLQWSDRLEWYSYSRWERGWRCSVLVGCDFD